MIMHLSIHSTIWSNPNLTFFFTCKKKKKKISYLFLRGGVIRNCISQSALRLTQICLLSKGLRERLLPFKMQTYRALFFYLFSSQTQIVFPQDKALYSTAQIMWDTLLATAGCYSLASFTYWHSVSLLISLKMERLSWAGSLHGAELFPAEQPPSGHGNQKYVPTCEPLISMLQQYRLATPSAGMGLKNPESCPLGKIEMETFWFIL